jgi:GT2 family glycosyltransferase
VVLVHWNQHCDLLSTIDAFCRQDVPLRFVVVDNASRQDEREGLKHGLDARTAAGTSIELLEMDHNAGFGPGANAGLEAYMAAEDRSEWAVLAPHDIDVEPGTLSTMLEAAGHQPMAGLMCADVGDGMSPVIDPYFGGMIVPGSPEPGWQEVDYPHGTLMMLRGATLDEVGVFDPRYFSYCEEADLALRARERGWQVGLVRGAMVKNLNLGSSVKLVDYLQTRNTLLLVQENSGLYHALIRICFTLAQIVRGVRRPETRPPVFDARARMAGIRDFFLRRFGPPPADL